MTLFAQISKIRKKFEICSFKKEDLISLYQNYNPSVGDVECFIEASYSLFPNLNCGIACTVLKKFFPTGQIIQGKYQDQSHTFFAFNESTIIDITADQFGGLKIYIGPLQDPWNVAK